MRRHAVHLSRWTSLHFVSVAALMASAQLLAGSTRLPSHLVPGDTTIAAAVNDQTTPFLAPGGSTVLAVWSDNRANSTGGYEGETSWDIYGLRFDGSGNPLEAVPFAIAAGRASQIYPRASWNGTNWLVVYESSDVSGTGYYQSSMQAVRVTPEGQVLDLEPIKMYGISPATGWWAVASDGLNWVIAGQGTSVGSEIVALRISADGAVLDAGPPTMAPGTYYMRSNFHLAYAGGVFLLTYDEMATGSSPTSSVRFDSNLVLLDPAPVTLVGSPVMGLASIGSGFYAVWHEQLPNGTMTVKGTRIDTSGQRLDGSGVNISGSNPPQAYTTTNVVWDGTNWKVTWGATSVLRIARIDTAGQVLDPGGVAVPGPQTGPTASAGNGSVQLIWSEFVTTNNYDVFGAHVSSSNTAGANEAVAIGAPAQLQADVAAGASGFMMVYRSSTSSTVRILAQPLDAAGNPTTTEPVVLDTDAASNPLGAAAIAWNGALFMAVWQNPSGVVARRLAADGTFLDPDPFVVLNPGFGPVDVESLGGNFLVVGLRCGLNCQVVFPIAARVQGSDGLVLDPSPIAMGVSFCHSPRIAVLGGRWLVAWHDNVTHDNSTAYTRGTFIDTAGVKAPDFIIHGPFSTNGGNGIFTLGLASSGSVALMVQSQELTSGVETDLLGRLIDPAGNVQPYFNMTPWLDDQYRPRAAWDGSQFVVVFQDQKVRFADSSLEPLDARSDLFGMRITAAGTIVDPQGFVFSNSATGEAYPTVATLAGTTLIAGSIVRNDATNANYRIGYDLFGTGGNAWPVAVASAAPTGGDVPLSIDFSSAGSSDPDGTLAAYAWDFGDGATSTEAEPTHFYTLGGPYVATLAVTDDGGAQTTQEVLIQAVEPNVPPVAVASSDRTSGPVPLSVIFYATGSYDPDGYIGNIEWTFSDGGTDWGSPAYHTFYAQGTHLVTLIVHDARGGTGTDTLTITAGTPNPPAAPSGLFALAFTADWINMTWADNSNNEDGFKVERCLGTAVFCDANPANFAQIAQTGLNINYYGDTGLPGGTTFSYRVRAFNGTANSAYSNTSAATTFPPLAVIFTDGFETGDTSAWAP